MFTIHCTIMQRTDTELWRPPVQLLDAADIIDEHTCNQISNPETLHGATVRMPPFFLRFKSLGVMPLTLVELLFLLEALG